jgi:F-type H+-transporting ATPase subunit epsilon
MPDPQPTTTRDLRLVVVTPERAVLDEPASFVALPLYDGELGVLPGRLPLIGRLGFGELRLVRGTVTRRYYIDGGFVQIRGNVVTVLTSRAVPAAQINIAAAREVLVNSQRAAPTPAAQDANLKAQQRARAQIHIAQKETHPDLPVSH